MSCEYDFTKELTLKECEAIVQKYRDYLSDEYEHAKANEWFQKAVGEAEYVDQNCVFAVTSLIYQLSGIVDPTFIDPQNVYQLSEMFRIVLTLDSLVDEGLLEKSGDGYLFSKRKAGEK